MGRNGRYIVDNVTIKLSLRFVLNFRLKVVDEFASDILEVYEAYVIFDWFSVVKKVSPNIYPIDFRLINCVKLIGIYERERGKPTVFHFTFAHSRMIGSSKPNQSKLLGLIVNMYVIFFLQIQWWGYCSHVICLYQVSIHLCAIFIIIILNPAMLYHLTRIIEEIQRNNW